MLDSNWDIVDGETAHEIELLNYITQTKVLECLVRLLLHLKQRTGQESVMPAEKGLLELHRAGTLFLLSHPGEYRDCEVRVTNGDVTIHQPPSHTQVAEHMAQFWADLGSMWKSADAVTVAAFALWKINWIHPFKNGNGRTARAFSYACLCLKIGFVLPGAPTVIDLIMANRTEYQDALAHSDRAAEASQIDVAPMRDFIERLLIIQLNSISDNPNQES